MKPPVTNYHHGKCMSMSEYPPGKAISGSILSGQRTEDADGNEVYANTETFPPGSIVLSYDDINPTTDERFKKGGKLRNADNQKISMPWLDDDGVLVLAKEDKFTWSEYYNDKRIYNKVVPVAMHKRIRREYDYPPTQKSSLFRHKYRHAGGVKKVNLQKTNTAL
jgi:hypothetical protein